MGFEMGTYAGVFVKIKAKQIEVEATKYVDDFGNESYTKFNPNTGKEYRQVTYTKILKDSPKCFGLPDGLDEEMFFCPEFSGFDNGWNGFLLNYGGTKYTLDTQDPNEGCVIEINDSINIKSLIQEFEEEFKLYLNYWKSKYEIVEVKYGVINYWM